ncbi:MAG: 2-enoate reductase [Bacillota bacterium]|jgi:2-enoate reductase|nr:2-enoate reductase [Bacillota bacterium]MDK2856373.1 2-enoate reductase [Bacillota bacterium]MDK2925538.1 2-enoate reductase [Bacillota bacterium]
MTREYSHLFTPGRIGRLELKNRIVMAPMGNIGMCELDGRPSEQMIEYYVERARGGAGLLITGLVLPSYRLEPLLAEEKWALLPRIDGLPFLFRWRELVKRVHAYGAKIALQLTAGFGRVLVPQFAQGKMVGVSALRNYWDPRQTLRELTTEEIDEFIKDFAKAAYLAREAGFDAIELHGHEGYLMDQFTSPLWNKRTDKFGGDLLGRLTFPIEIIKAIRQAVGDSLPIIYRYDLTHNLPGGRSEEEGLKMGQILESVGVDAFDVDKGTYDNWYWPHPPVYQPRACMADAATKLKQVVKVPVMAVGKLGYPDVAEGLLAENKADFIILGRALLADPEWPNKVRRGAVDDIRPCIGDQEACIGALARGEHLSCAVNPACARERQYRLTPAATLKKVVVIGGGPAGMEAALVASKRGHRVILYEKAGELGGQLIPAGRPSFKSDVELYRQYLIRQVNKAGIEVRLGQEASASTVAADAPDVVICALGMIENVPPVPGMDLPHVVMAKDVLLGKKEAGKTVVVVGGGAVGCETALFLAQQGKSVTIVEMLPKVMPDVMHANREMLLMLLKEAGVRILTEHVVDAVTTDEVVTLTKNWRRETLPADSVVIAVGGRPNNKLYQELASLHPEVYNIGDSLKPGRVLEAVLSAYEVARQI